jgi:AcrR family transcriptional regulator
MTAPTKGAPREYLNPARVLDTAVAVADEAGIEAVSMRKLAQKLGVVPMALYKHVANKEELLDGIVDVVVSEIAPPDPTLDWKPAIRARILSARAALLRHPWARQVMESKATPTPVVLDYIESTIAILVAGGLSIDLTHHALHALGSRIFGFSQELYNDSQNADPMPPEAIQMLAQMYPHSAAVAASRRHEQPSVIGSGCDDQFEFEFALDIVLDGLERLHRQGWSSSARTTSAARG